MKKRSTLVVTTPGDREIALTRIFDAPRALVFEALTKPEYLVRWFGVFRDWRLAVCEMDLRPGGRYRWEWHGDEGRKMGMGGTFLEVVPPERLVSTEQFDDPWYEGQGRWRYELSERDGRTTLVLTATYDSRTIRDAVLAGPMAEGVEANYDALAEFLAR